MGRKKRGFRLPHKLSYSQRFHMKRAVNSVDWAFLAAAVGLVVALVLAVRYLS